MKYFPPERYRERKREREETLRATTEVKYVGGGEKTVSRAFRLETLTNVDVIGRSSYPMRYGEGTRGTMLARVAKWSKSVNGEPTNLRAIFERTLVHDYIHMKFHKNKMNQVRRRDIETKLLERTKKFYWF